MQAGKATIYNYNFFDIIRSTTTSFDYKCESISITDDFYTTEATANAYTLEEAEKLNIILKQLRINAKNRSFINICLFFEKLCNLYNIHFTISAI